MALGYPLHFKPHAVPQKHAHRHQPGEIRPPAGRPFSMLIPAINSILKDSKADTFICISSFQEVFLVYFKSLLRYSLTLLRTLFFICILMLIYLLASAVLLKSRDVPSFFIDSVKNYGIVIIRLLPFVTILASLIYFSNIASVTGRPFMITMIPILTVINTFIFCASFFISGDFIEFAGQTRTYYYPDIQTDAVSDINGYKIVLKSGARGALFYNNLYLFNNFRSISGNITLDTGTAVFNSSLGPSYSHLSLPFKVETVNPGETGISDYLINNLLASSRRLLTVFSGMKAGSSLPALIISILFMNLGFFALSCSFAVFFSDRQTILLSWSVILFLSVVLFLVLPQYFILISIIKSGIKNTRFNLILPSIFVGLPGGLVGYILISLRTFGQRRKAAQ